VSGSEARAEPYLRVDGLSYRSEGFSLGPLSFSLEAGESLAVLGPNGAGKSTVLRLLAGLDRPDAGRILLGGRDLTALPAHRRGIGMVFQDLALFPARTVWENVAYGLEVQRSAARVTEVRVEELLEQFRLRPYAERYPHELSGGERQRVALARSLAPRPALLLLDEPLASVDYRFRRELQGELKALLGSAGTTVLYVTHDFDEGFFLADRVAILREGRWVQDGSPRQVFEHPRTTFVAWFLGYNLVPEGTGWGAVLPTGLRLLPREGPLGKLARVESVGGEGPAQRAYVRLDGDAREEQVLLEVRGEGLQGRLPRPGEAVRVAWERSEPVEEDMPAPSAGFKRGTGSAARRGT
jgi:ABC-type sulfate/molybdate transport systems ATPase subunit